MSTVPASPAQSSIPSSPISPLLTLARRWVRESSSPSDSRVVVVEHCEFAGVTPDAEADSRQGQTDFINTYASWADVVELPRVMHEAVAIQLVASLLNTNRVFIRNGPLWYPMDLWMVLISQSGGGRSSLLDFAKQLMAGAGVFEGENRGGNGVQLPENPINDCRWGSAPAFFQELSRNRDKNLYVWGELSEKFALFNSGPFKQYGAKAWFTDLYDKRSKPESIKYRETGKPSDTAPIEFDFAPRINILAGSSEDWFYNNLHGDDSLGGWLPRWMFVRTGPRSRSCPRPTEPDPSTRTILANQLRAISQFSGEASMAEEIWKDYESWYVETQHRFDTHSNPALAAPYWNRHKGHILKLAVIFEASLNATKYASNGSGKCEGLLVGWDAWNRAKAKCAELEGNIFEMLGSGMSAVGYTLKRYEERIRLAGEGALLRSDFTRTFQDDPERDRHLATLIAGDVVHTFLRAGKGRTGTMLVHRDHCGGKCVKCHRDG